MFDVAVIGAGVCGCAVSHFLTRSELRVALFDKGGIASGGSGAAGAFISPKITKSGPLKEIVEQAHLFSHDFYKTRFGGFFMDRPLLHIAKYDDENEKVLSFKASTKLTFSETPPAVSDLLTPYAKSFESVYLDKSGVVDARAVCERMAEGTEFFQESVRELRFEEGVWHVGKVKAKTVVLATGAYESVVELPYIVLRGVWGHRIDIKTATHVPCNIHHLLSVSPTREDGITALGATHNVHYHPEKCDTPYDVESGRAELIEKALKSVRLEAIEVVADFTGLRSGSNDYLPICGHVPDARKSFAKLPGLLNGERHPDDALVHYPNLYMINGTGGYGFVLAPYLAKMLCDTMLANMAGDPRLLPSRFLARWAKRSEEARRYKEA